MKITLVTNNDDWEGIYFDGVCVDQGHSLRMMFVLNQLIGKTIGAVEEREVDNDWFYEEGGLLPYDLNDVVFVDKGEIA